jgi:hypothetical protein
MRHLTVESKNLLIGDEVADLLTQYAAIVADHGRGDRVHLHAISSDGDEVVLTIVLSAGTTLITETAHTGLPEPDNAEAIDYLLQRIRQLRTPPPVQPMEAEAWESQFDEL